MLKQKTHLFPTNFNIFNIFLLTGSLAILFGASLLFTLKEAPAPDESDTKDRRQNRDKTKGTQSKNISSFAIISCSCASIYKKVLQVN